MAEIDKKLLTHLAGLARLELTDAESEKFVTDLGNILKHFQELKSLDTTNVVPMTGGTMLKNILREDVPESVNKEERQAIIDAFPDEKGGYLKTPAVFE